MNPQFAAGANAVRIAASAGEVQAPSHDADRRPRGRADPVEALEVGAHGDRVGYEVGPARGCGAGEVAAAAVTDDRHAAAGGGA